MAVKSRNMMLLGLTLLFLLALTSSPVMALDTLEPYDPGLSDFEFYTALLGLGQPERTIRGDVLIGIGLNDWLSGHIYGAGEADQHLDGKGAEFGFGIFSTEGEFIEVHRSPVIPHIGTEIPRPPLAFGGFQTFEGKILHECN